MKRMGLIATALIGATALAVTVAAASNRGATPFNFVRATQSYSCGDIIFSETVDNPSAYSDINDVSSIYTTSLDCSMTNWTNANYKAGSAIKIGGSKTGKYSGSVDLKLNSGLTTDKVIVYATGWYGDSSNLKVGVNGSEQDITTTSGSYVFSPYIFNLGSATDSIILTNNSAATGKSRTVISKLVFRLYGSSGGGGGGGTTSGSTSEPPSTSTTEEQPSIITITPSNLTAVASEADWSDTYNGVTLTSHGIVTSDQIRVYKSQTLTIASSNYITDIQFTCTAEDSNKYGPGCFTASGGTYSYNSYTGSWSGSTKSVSFTASLNQVRITQIVITFN